RGGDDARGSVDLAHELAEVLHHLDQGVAQRVVSRMRLDVSREVARGDGLRCGDARPEIADHGLELAGQVTELIAAADLDALVDVARGDRARGLAELTQRADD